ncbi:MAG: NAD-dependent deacylase [Lewinellaceae bacterium]|nr:NAD-dependent deacylase [Saprospiraceae bacterium]MCB9340763.1 NAD-dependent deacylase [Lewinellaceae bacterium]
MKKKIVVLSGAGMSAESGIKTFRDADGLWENHDIMEVATPEGWRRNMELVLEFYNQRRRQLFEVQPNAGHKALVDLEAVHEVDIVTQNVDDLHERAGSTRVLHLHGELAKARSTFDERLVYEWKKDILVGDKCEKGSQLRPHIVWFGEEVPMLEPAIDLMDKADIAIIIGTSMQVYPAAGLIGYANPDTAIFYIDPKPAINYELRLMKNLEVLAENASTGVRKVVDRLLGT